MPLYTYVIVYKDETYVSQLSRSNFKGFVGELINSIPASAFGGIDSRTRAEITKVCYGLNAKSNQANVWEASGEVLGNIVRVFAVETVK